MMLGYIKNRHPVLFHSHPGQLSLDVYVFEQSVDIRPIGPCIRAGRLAMVTHDAVLSITNRPTYTVIYRRIPALIVASYSFSALVTLFTFRGHLSLYCCRLYQLPVCRIYSVIFEPVFKTIVSDQRPEILPWVPMR